MDRKTETDLILLNESLMLSLGQAVQLFSKT